MCAKKSLILAWALLLALVAAGPAPAQERGPRFPIVEPDPGLSTHKPMFVLPATWSDDYHGKLTEAVFQISAKHRIFGSRFYFGYRQISFWQAYDFGNSAPFRDTNYNPELFHRFPTQPWGGGRAGLDLGFEHESNGQVVPLSRSWNLLYAAPHWQRGPLLLRMKLRWRFPEDGKETPDAAEGDDNPDITDYLGHADLHLYYRLPGAKELHLKVRGNPSTGRAYGCLDFTLPLRGGEGSNLMFRISSGWGESMLDYNRKNTRAGIGMAFGL